MSDEERWLSLVGGASLVLLGLGRTRLSGLAMLGLGAALLHRGYSQHCQLYEMLGIDTAGAAGQGASTSVPAQHGERVERAVIVQRPAADLFRAWRDLESLPKRLRHLKKVESLEKGRSRWTAEAPLGESISWEAEIIQERENELIAWRSIEGSSLETAGSVHFKELPHGRGTEIRVNLKYNPPGGKLGAWVASLFGSGLPQQLESDLQRFKSEMEAGESPSIEGQPHGQS